MNITLETVRATLRKSFGRESFIASFISSVQEDSDITSACIDAQGVMRYNSKFVSEYVTEPEDLFCLIAHELMHPMFGHFVYNTGQLENIAGDAVINAVISRVYSTASGNGALFRKIYEETGITGLLRPSSEMHHCRYSRLYDVLYQRQSCRQKLSTGEVIQSLKVLTSANETPSIFLLGGHGASEKSGGKLRDDSGTCSKTTKPSTMCTQNHLPSELLSRIAEDFKRNAEEAKGHYARHGTSLCDFFLEVLQTHLTLKRALLERFTTQRKVDNFRVSTQRSRIGVSPIPIQPSKRDFVLVAAGIPPFHYHNQAYRQSTEGRGLAIYLDVSGSGNEYLPEIIGLLRSLKTDLKSIFLFSNKIVEVPFKRLLKGEIETTYGTDFDCIAEHILENHLDKAVVITDGWASMTDENQEALREQKVNTLTVLFGSRKDCPEFQATGPIMRLDEITK